MARYVRIGRACDPRRCRPRPPHPARPLLPEVDADRIASELSEDRTVTAGLVLGKLAAVVGALALVLRLRLGRLPDGVVMRDIVGMAAIAGIGFTVSIFIAGLAFDDPALADQATIGVLVATVAAACGAALFAIEPARTPDPGATVDGWRRRSLVVDGCRRYPALFDEG